MSQRKEKRNSITDPGSLRSLRRLLCFRLTALVALPLLSIGLLELGLRVAGFGYPTAFLLKSSNHGEDTFIQNSQFGWRFFGPRAARLPVAISIPREKPADTLRIFVFGESAAYGEPQPHFGLPRMLQAILELRHPEKHFEVVNAAMTGINSHVILPLARDCQKAQADLWILYIGNNEVVGPFGAGTVFGSQTMPLPLIRAGIALKATRTGQWLDSLQRAARKNPGSGEWEGMRMFVDFKVAASDSRLGTVYKNFARNLKDIIAAGQSSGAKIVLSTVAVNLKDCAPFASLHRANLSESGLEEWRGFFAAGAKAQEGGDFAHAAAEFEQAERIDGTFAELRFRQGQCALRLRDAGAAQKSFAAARDLDALRFRCDSRLNDIIRQQPGDGVALVDGERTLAEASADGIPGADLFYEHVHLTFAGNYLLARAIAQTVEQVLKLPEKSPWPKVAECEQRLAHTPRDTQLALSDIFGRVADAPFTGQANHDQQMRRLTEAAQALPSAKSASALQAARSAAESALERWPRDGVLWEQLGQILQAQRDYAGAAVAFERALSALPSSAECWMLDGTVLAQQSNYREAISAFKHVFALDPQAVSARFNLALCLQNSGRLDEALAGFKHTLALKPNYGTAWLALGQLYEEMGRTNDAQLCYTKALTNRVNQVGDLTTLARFCVSRRWYDLAATNFSAAIELVPSDPGLRLEAARALSAAGRHAEAARQCLSAVDLEPDQVAPHMRLGVELGYLGQPASAEKEFRKVLSLDPASNEARVDLGIALYEQKKLEEAREQFDSVLHRHPEDPTALHYSQLLRNEARSP